MSTGAVTPGAAGVLATPTLLGRLLLEGVDLDAGGPANTVAGPDLLGADAPSITTLRL